MVGSRSAIAASGISASSNARSIASKRRLACSGVARRSSIRLRVTSSRIRRLQRTVIEGLLRDTEQRVAQRQRVQHTRVEHDGERHAPKISRPADANDYS